MDPTIRADLAELPAYVPGRTIPGAIKLASNEVSLPPPPAMLDAIADAARSGNRYPDTAATALTERLAERHGVAPEQIATGCGAVTLCEQLALISCSGPDDELMYAWRSFEMYPIVTRIAGATHRRVPLDADGRHDLAAMAASVSPATRLIFVCSPNNPTGTAVHRRELLRFLEAVPPQVLVVLDEAYHEFVTDPRVPNGMDLLAGRPNLVVLRTFSKAYRMAGLRVGYAVADPAVAEMLRKVAMPFSVNSLAQAAATTALDCLPELLATCADVAVERTRVHDELLAAGYRVPESQANFVWLPLGERTTDFTLHCQQHKVLVRPMAGDGARVTVAGRSENDAFLAAALSFSG